ncbi:ATP-binding protein [Alteromonas sp. BMJM2]|uniref:ATP-binding protein n=1 Tax=Alteromonas sp. BMJM2 TaxID=2954241 RepID=UPI0022B555BB|nr:AAA family ATPase [Alteromonas sp. BMJM2]
MNAVKPSVAVESIATVIRAGLVPMIHGSPGTGKSDIVRKVAKEFNLEVIDERLANCDPTDLKGFPKVNGDVATFIPFDTFPTTDSLIPEGKDGWLLFLDELPHAPESVQKAAYKILLDRMVGGRKLHPQVAIVAAGNLESDGAFTSRSSTAMQSRLVHIELMVNTADWIAHAQEQDYDPRVVSYIQYRPSNLQMFDPDHTDYTFACPRTWEFASKLLGKMKDVGPSALPLLAGTLGEGAAREFIQFLNVFEQLPSIQSIESGPETVNMPYNDGGTLFALSGMLADNVTKSNVNSLMRYVNRMPREFQVITIRDMSRRYPLLTQNELFMNKAMELSALI